MKISNVPEIRFPGFTDDWEQRKLGDIVEFYSGLTYSPDNIVSEKGVFVLRSSNVKSGELVDADNVYVDSNVVNSSNVQKGDIIVVVRNGSRSLIGKHAQVKYDMDNTVIGAFMTGIRSRESNFINALLDTQQFKIEINKNLGATINQITTGAFKKMFFSVPSNLVEQQKIGTFFKQFDDTIALHQQELTNLKKIKQGFLQKMFPKEGEKVPEIRFPGFADDWEQRKFLDIVTRLSSTSNSVILPKVEFEDIVAGEGRLNKDISDKLDNRKGIVFKPGNILYGKLRPYLKNWLFADFEGIALGDFWVFEANNSVPVFVYYLIQASNYQKVANDTAGTKMPRSDWKKVSKTFFEIPKIEEQQKIGIFFKQLDDTIALHQRELEILKETKKAFLQKMFV